ncbi:MAG: hypothetical protein MIO92_11780, partial [Methanosarcinaceae archaeon]|nr:hypothetical protein [Methanosarcinaceae archaeon]
TLMQQTVRQVRKDMTRGFYLRLPKLTTTELTTKPRIFAIALEIINSCEGRLQIDPVIHFVQAYQDITPLTIGEVWALPIMLRLSVLEYLTQAIAKTIDIQLSDSSKPSVFINLPEGLRNEDVIINAILNLRVLETQDWKVFFDRVSVVQHILRADPAGVYNNMDFDTRDLYRNEIEQLATATELSEQEIAQKATCLAQKKFTSEKGGSVERESHVGYYLVDSGREKLENEIGYHPPWNVRFKRWLLDHPTPLYLGSIGVLTLIILFLLIGIALYRETTPPQLTAITILLLIPTLVTTKQLVNQLLPYLISPRTLPKLDFKESIPADCRTMVVMPVLLRSIEEVTFLLRNIELHFLGNNDPHISFALLTDFPDAPEKQMPNDIVLIDQAAAGIKKLNKRHHQSQSKPFYLFHRERVWNPSEGVWMGWERKRGKLIELNRLLLNSEKTTYTLQVGDLATLAKIRYVITLDRDTILPRGSAHRLIGTLAHPLNRPQFEHQTDKVIAGYTILQPRTEITPTSAYLSLFTKIFAGDTELDLYTLAVSNVYQDFFGEGIYVGKGIYDVSAFERTLREKVPENALLSHDLFEGIHGRVGLVSDIVLFEDFPSNYLAYVQRLHRWVRGDWQLLPWLMPRVPSREKNTIPNTFSLINIWKIADNLCRSLFVPALMLLMVLAWLGYLGSALLWTVLALLTPALLPTFNLITKFFNSIRDGSLRTFVPSIKLQALRWLLTLVFLPYQTFTILDAIVRTLV